LPSEPHPASSGVDPAHGQRRRRDAKELIASLSSCKFVDVAAPTGMELATWRKTIDFAKRHGLVRPGHRLEKQMLNDDLLRFKLVSGVHANTKTLREMSPVPINDSSSRTG
jgi:hypothetical protein